MPEELSGVTYNFAGEYATTGSKAKRAFMSASVQERTGTQAMTSTRSAKKVALVTGASSGIGKAIVGRLLSDGFTVYGAARRVDHMQDIRAQGAKVLALDLTDEDSLQAAVAKLLEAEGRIDVLINNAGYGSYGAIEDVPIAEARRQFEVNLFGLARLSQLVLPAMRAARSGDDREHQLDGRSNLDALRRLVSRE
jgi:NAD(P)-dependent dehydrogenase (short-subunit alcohol dehydrogenase family)